MTEATAPMERLAAEASILLCCGSGGVGKTTTAAVVALEAARLGRRAVVVTIDPAKRLADALGLGELTNTPSLIDGPWPGELSALMLDTESTFNGLVARYAGSADQAEKIL
ncbi:MAG TPA: ArsA-related P-loop ATPase, partial [Microthrixaceae bacterium]|nr:ArsA-related P-loop ATPase [Microthrixaceae bacterium]